jgi:lipopolysaccharide export system permease protein
MGSLGKINPIIALWVPFFLFCGLCWWLYHTLAHVPGGQPIGALERASDKAVAAIKRWMRGDEAVEAA